MADEGLEISVIKSDAPLIKLVGEVDFHNAHRISDAVGELFKDSRYNISIDASNLEFIDSSGLSALLDAAKAARSNNGEIRLVEPGPQLIHVLTIAGFADFFSITPTDRDVTTPKPSRPADQTARQVTQFDVPPQTDLIADIRNRVATFASSLPFSEQDIEDIKLAVGEASSNALRYGCPGADDKILVRCCNDGRSLSVQIKDCGPCFNPDNITPPPIDALDEGGRGIYFMRTLMDEVKFYFSPSGTTVELVKYLK